MEKNVVTRIPPSPTGHFHIGTARTALFNYLFTKKHNGKFVYRSEDTDKERSTEVFESEIKEGITWLGMEWDEFHRQSERSEIYTKYLKELIDADKAYISKEPSKKDPSLEVEVVRLRNPNKEISFTDLVLGKITFDTTELGDLVIARSIDDALYHFAVVVDDNEMGITHVIRGADHVSNTPRQILIQEALGFSRPEYAHIPLILGSDKSKMSKRHGATAMEAYREKGYLPEAIVNYLALLGWNPGTDRELFSMKELIEAFDLSQVQKSGAVFDIEKLNWFNREYLQNLDDAVFLQEIDQRLSGDITKSETYTDERRGKLLPIIKERIKVFSDIEDMEREGELGYFFKKPEYDIANIKWKKDTDITDALPRLKQSMSIITDIPEANFSAESLKEALWPYAEEIGKGEVLWPLRYALSGQEKSPDPFTIADILGKEEVLLRLQNACDTIEENA